MPTYDYKCLSCGHRFEGVAKMNDPNPPCPHEPPQGMTCEVTAPCGGDTQKVFSTGNAPAVQFNGGGWAKDGYSK